MTKDKPVIALTSGEPAGIGPELCVRLCAERLDARVVAIGERELLRGCPHVEHVALQRSRVPGKLDPANSRYVLAVLERAVRGCLEGEFDAMVTAPVHKGVINDALQVLDADLRRRFRIARPRILVAGLNPHSGESGHLGREDIEVIAPAIAAAADTGIAARGPIPADTLFVPERLSAADCALAMYHDQGLPVLKYASFGRGVNVTLGLPFVRTSVDHGTALELAGTGKADPGSLIEATKLAIELASAA